jgi:hypothetical protein
MQSPKFNFVIHSGKKPLDFQTLNHYSQGLPYFYVVCSERHTSKFWLWNLDFKTFLDFGGRPLRVPPLLMCCKSRWILITLMLIHYLSCSKPQAPKIHGTTKNSKWTLKRRIVVMGIPTIFSNFTKPLIILPSNSTKSLISNNGSPNPIYYLLKIYY